MANYLVAPIVRSELRAIWYFIRRSFRQKAHRNLRVRPVEGFDKYLVLYREITGSIEILHVINVARNIGALLRKDQRS